MSLPGMTITLLLMIGVMSVAFARPNPVAFESPDYLAEWEESIEMEDVQTVQNDHYYEAFKIYRLPLPPPGR